MLMCRQGSLCHWLEMSDELQFVVDAVKSATDEHGQRGLEEVLQETCPDWLDTWARSHGERKIV